MVLILSVFFFFLELNKSHKRCEFGIQCGVVSSVSCSELVEFYRGKAQHCQCTEVSK